MRGVWGAGNWEAPPPHLIRSSVSEKRFGATRSTTVLSWTVLSRSWHLGRCSSSLNDRQSSGTGRQGKPCLTLARQNRGGSTTTVISDPSPVSCSPAAAYRSRWQAAGGCWCGSCRCIQHPASGMRGVPVRYQRAMLVVRRTSRTKHAHSMSCVLLRGGAGYFRRQYVTRLSSNHLILGATRRDLMI